MKRRPRLLIADDKKEIRNLLKRVLKPEGYDVVLAPNGREALAMYQKHKPDLVILDITMPDLSGLEVLGILRQSSNVPVIMITGQSEITEMDTAMGLNADDFVRKPFYMKELLSRIKAKLKRTVRDD
jgi:two-component system response regulator VicR